MWYYYSYFNISGFNPSLESFQRALKLFVYCFRFNLESSMCKFIEILLA